VPSGGRIRVFEYFSKLMHGGVYALVKKGQVCMLEVEAADDADLYPCEESREEACSNLYGNDIGLRLMGRDYVR